MGAVKQALIEVEDLVCGCLQQHRTLNQTKSSTSINACFTAPITLPPLLIYLNTTVPFVNLPMVPL